MSVNYHVIADKLVSWYASHARDLPWRKTTDPYKIWISEIILQQTTVRQGLDYYNNFAKHFPDVGALANASLDDVMKMWEGLGYYSRARNLHSTACYVNNTLNGQFPKTYQELILLKGVGPYTAAAIASFAFNLPHVVIDGNVMRLFSRLFRVHTSIDKAKTKKEFESIGQKMLSKQSPYIFNQSIMEFGALQCLPRNPECKTCVLNSHCGAYKSNEVGLLPKKSKKLIKKERFFHYTVLEDAKHNTIIHQRNGNDIWRGLYEFPVQEVSKEDFDNYSLPDFLNQTKLSSTSSSSVYKQHLSHQIIYSKFFKLITKKGVFLHKQNNYLLVPFKHLSNFAFPRTSCLYLSDNSITLV